MASYSTSIPSSWGIAATVLVVFLIMSPTVASSHPTSTHHHHHHHHPWTWESLRNLSGCHHGDHRAGLSRLKQYFHRFGYFPGSPANFSDDFDGDLESALVAYQHNFHLKPTGTLDVPTLSVLSTPRCGVADFGINSNGTTPRRARGRSLYSFLPGSPRWPANKRHLTYDFTFSASDTVRALTARAFKQWSDHSVFSFSQTTGVAGADIRIGFHRGDHGDGSPFDGMGGVLAHAFPPTIGWIHVDADEQWVVAGDVTQASSPDAMDMESVLVHEIGHVLGLGHSNKQGAIMYPSIERRTRRVDLTKDDVRGIQSLYANN